MDYHLAMKNNNKLLTNATTWMNLWRIMLSGKTIPNVTYCNDSIYVILKWQHYRCAEQMSGCEEISNLWMKRAMGVTLREHPRVSLWWMFSNWLYPCPYFGNFTRYYHRGVRIHEISLISYNLMWIYNDLKIQKAQFKHMGKVHIIIIRSLSCKC